MKMDSMIKLFKAVLVNNKKTKFPTEEVLEATIARGFIFSPNVIANYSEKELMAMANLIRLSSEELNSSFHKSWDKIKNAKMKQLVMEQIIHYFTTYGMEDLGIFNHDSVYIPAEKLDIPKIEDSGFKFVIIDGLTKKELKEKLLSFLETGIALKEETIKDVITISGLIELTEKDVNNIKNKETKIIMQDKLGVTPEDPVEFLRLMVYKATEETLIIKNRKMFNGIKENNSIKTSKFFKDYSKEYGQEKLAAIFYRFKPIFLAFRNHTGMKPQINKIRKLAVKNHKPMPENYLDNVTSKIKKGTLNISELNNKLKTAPIFKKIKLAYALKYRIKDVDSIMYKIRNGRGYTTDFEFKQKKVAGEIYEIVLQSIIKDMNVKGKKIYIPENVEYALPATEKQFVGNVPAGTSVGVPKDMIFGVHWENVDGRVDLDLSLIDVDGDKYGWDGGCRSSDRSILFSGDITDAPKPKGASELFYISNKAKGNFILFNNFFNYRAGCCIPYRTVIAEENIKDLEKNYLINPNNIVMNVDSIIKDKQKVVGIIIVNKNETRYYFAETVMGESISCFNNKNVVQTRKYLIDFYTNSINLNDVLKQAGAKLVTDKKKCDIDLSPEMLDKTTIIDLIN